MTTTCQAIEAFPCGSDDYETQEVICTAPRGHAGQHQWAPAEAPAAQPTDCLVFTEVHGNPSPHLPNRFGRPWECRGCGLVRPDGSPWPE
jgi:hypothetical protein